MAEEEKAKKVKEKAKPEGVELKEIAKRAGLEPRECRAILRKLGIRGVDQHRQRWVFATGEVAGIVAKIKAAKVAKEKAKAEKASSKEEEEEE